ncbi:putative class IV aminotransferase [Colletotrichum karsti]|uniref:Class IV aminotransferase n=1 Tax=Colletotrichum karsti TaxID=1095194 RepID=A0A9P6LHS5_9PEZI|nr:putative class IV aminotransferase [Colletotrichum karsti]KAF9873898.1 putative class IV aminotransferase [Colletotrichum karsti]
MSPSAIEDHKDDVPVVTKSSPSTSPAGDFSTFRSIVPVVADDKITYLNASYQPPSNLIIHAAITKFSAEALYSNHPKPQWQNTVEETRGLVARYINADASEVAFTRDTTEGLNSFIRGLKFEAGDNVVVLDSEHPNHVYGWMALRSAGLEVRQVSTIPEAEKTGKVTAANAATFAPYVDERTRAIGISSVMFHSGQWNDVEDISKTYRPRGIHVLADLTQQVGFAETDVKALGVSAAAFSLHKGLNNPTGFGVLYVDSAVIKEIDPVPAIVGAGAISYIRPDLLVPSDPVVYHPTTRRYEHLNLSLIAAATAKAFLTFYLDSMGPRRVQEHLYRLGDELREECRALGIKVVGPTNRKEHAPHLYILDLHDERWMDLFKEQGVIVTPYRLGVRVSFGFYNNSTDVKKFAKVLKTGVESGLPI